MNNIDQFDLEFINDNCPQGKVPVFFVKGDMKNSGLHKTIKEIYQQVGNKIGRKIPCLPAVDEIIVEKEHKDNYVWVYYATPEERDLLRNEKHRLMNLNFREKISTSTSCFSFNDKGEYNDAFRIPLGKVKTIKDVHKIANQIKESILLNEAFIRVVPRGNNDYALYFSAFTPKSRMGFCIRDLTKAHAQVQLALLDNFENHELDLCDFNGNYYNVEDERAVVQDKINSLVRHQKIKQTKHINTDAPTPCV